MKKLLFILVASLAFLTACEEDELVKQPAEGDAPTIIYATIDDELIKRVADTYLHRQHQRVVAQRRCDFSLHEHRPQREVYLQG